MVLEELNEFVKQWSALEKELKQASKLESIGMLSEERKAAISDKVVTLFKILPIEVRSMVFSHKQISDRMNRLGIDVSKIILDDNAVKKV